MKFYGITIFKNHVVGTGLERESKFRGETDIFLIEEG